MIRFCLLVMAKAPVAGRAKTRLSPPATPGEAASIAAAALLDTLTAVRRIPGAVPLVALTGDMAAAQEATALRAALDGMAVLRQRGNTFADRLVAAHLDAGAHHPGLPVVQIGMDTPQITPELLLATVAPLADHQATLGAAEDGGWWVLALRDPTHARALRDVPMSRTDTATLTRKALTARGLGVADGPILSDVDTMADATAVAMDMPGSRFAAAVAAVGAGAAR